MNRHPWKADTPPSRTARARATIFRRQRAILPVLLWRGMVLGLRGPGAADEPSFPRGTGLYFSIPKLLALVLLYFCWVRTCWWVDFDARELGLPLDIWNPLMLGCGLLGFLVVWLLPWFIVSFVVLLALYLMPSLAYVNLRNQRVPELERVMTKRHLKELAAQYLKLRFEERDLDDDTGPPVRFLGKSFNQQQEDPSRVAKAQESKGYKAALEMVYEAIQSRAT